MCWDFTELNPLHDATGSLRNGIVWVAECIDQFLADPVRTKPSFSGQADAVRQELSALKVVSTDPPYYDNIEYADISDFFYVPDSSRTSARLTP
jgi:putative DNA methylase